MATPYEALFRGSRIALNDRESGATVWIDPQHGANVTAFESRVGGRRLEVLSPRGIPILFPFPNRIPQGVFSWRGRRLRMDVNEHGRPNHIHGLVRDRAWSVAGISAAREGASATMTIALDQSEAAMRQYPFACRVEVKIHLAQGALTHAVSVANIGLEPMPMGYGIHPWFPAAIGGDRRDTQLRIPAARQWELSDKIPTGHTLPVEGAYDLRDWRAIGTEQYDDVFTVVARRPDGWSEAQVRYPAEAVIRVEASPEFREWVVFADDAHDAIAIEPYTCVTNAVNLAERGVDAGLLTLDPGATWQASVRITAGPASR